MDILRFYQDYSIPHFTEGKNVGAGWVNVCCPYCNDTSNHLGFSLAGNYFKCWRCGWHPFKETLVKLSGMGRGQLNGVLHQYGGASYQSSQPIERKKRLSHQLPSGTGTLITSHKQYLERRGFDSEMIENQWGVMGTGPISPH